MTYRVMHVSVNDKDFRVYGGNNSAVKKLTDWYNTASYDKLIKKHKWLTPDDKVMAWNYRK